MLCEGFAERWLRQWEPFPDLGQHLHLVNRDLLEPSRWTERFVHPWLRATGRVPHGKLWQTFLLTVPQVFYDPFARADDPERVHPLMSQPLMELCLQIPTYTLIAGGWNRALARLAFAQDVPRPIICRRTKGQGADHSRMIIQANVRFLREFMLDGLLVRAGLLDRTALERVLSGSSPGSDPASGELEDHLGTEIWARRWTAKRAQAAA